MATVSVSSISNSSEILPDLPQMMDSSMQDNSILKYFTVTVLSVFTLFLLRLNSVKRKNNPIYRMPSPPGLPFLGHVLKIITTKDIVGTFRELARQFPHYYRVQVGPLPVVLLTSPQSVEKLLSSTDDGHLAKADEYSVLADYFDDGLVTSCGEKWRSRRKLLAPLFNYKCFPHFLEVFNRHSKNLVATFDSMFPEPTPKPIQVPLYESLLRIICETAIGVELNDSSEEFDKFFEEAERTKEYIFLRMSRPWYRMEWIWKIHPFRRVYEANQKYIKDYIAKVNQEARRKYFEEIKAGVGAVVLKEKNKTAMEVMLESALSDSDIREEAHTIISAGHETSATALQFALMLLALNPEHQAKCQEEIDEIIKDESRCPNGDFTLISLADLKHTERCIKETLRIYPVANMTGRKLKTPLRIDDDLVLPAGTTCMMVATDIHRNPEIYPEPEKFDPSRFTPENCTARHPFAYVPFSAGPRICLGQKFATVQMKLIVGRILHHFTIETIDKLEDVPLDASVVLAPIRPYSFILRKRNLIPVYKQGGGEK